MRYRLLLLLPFVLFCCNDDNTVSLPPAPYDVKAVRLSETEISITWKDSSDVAGNYKLMRATNTSGYEAVATIPQGTKSYTDGALSPTATYTYLVTLVDVHGTSSEYSDPSAVTGLQSSQMSSFSIPDKNIGDSPFAITAPTTLNPEPITYTSSNLNVATVGGNVITIVGAGTTTITASQPTSSTFMAASSTASFTVH
jgi:hypothetical protein